MVTFSSSVFWFLNKEIMVLTEAVEDKMEVIGMTGPDNWDFWYKYCAVEKT